MYDWEWFHKRMMRLVEVITIVSMVYCMIRTLS